MVPFWCNLDRVLLDTLVNFIHENKALLELLLVLFFNAQLLHERLPICELDTLITSRLFRRISTGFFPSIVQVSVRLQVLVMAYYVDENIWKHGVKNLGYCDKYNALAMSRWYNGKYILACLQSINKGLCYH